MSLRYHGGGTETKRQHRKLTVEKKIIPPLLPGFELEPFSHESGALPTQLSRLTTVSGRSHPAMSDDGGEGSDI